MKIRTDFVTNSSSSSFSVMTISVKGEEYYLAGSEDADEHEYNDVEINDDYFPKLIDGRLYVDNGEQTEVSTVMNLMSWLLAAAKDDMYDWDFEKCLLMLQFATGRISAHDFVNLSRELNEYAFNDIDLLDEIADDDLRNTIIDNFYDYYDMDFDEIEPYIEIINNAENLSDIDNIWLKRKELNYDECMSDKELVYPDISELPALEVEAGRKFEKIEYNTEAYWDAVNTWESVLSDKVWIFGHRYSDLDEFEEVSLYSAVGTGIEEGDYNRIWEEFGSGRCWFSWSKYIEGKDIK